MLKSDVAELKSDVAELKVKVADLTEDVTVLKSDVAVLNVKVTELTADVTILKGNVTELRTDVNELAANTAGMNEQMIKTKEMLELRVVPRLDTIESCYTSTYRRYSEKTEQMDALRTDMDIVKKVVTEHSVKLHKLA